MFEIKPMIKVNTYKIPLRNTRLNENCGENIGLIIQLNAGPAF